MIILRNTYGMNTTSHISVDENVPCQAGRVQDHLFRLIQSSVSSVYDVQTESVRCGLAGGSQSSNVCRMQHTLGSNFL